MSLKLDNDGHIKRAKQLIRSIGQESKKIEAISNQSTEAKTIVNASTNSEEEGSFSDKLD